VDENIADHPPHHQNHTPSCFAVPVVVAMKPLLLCRDGRCTKRSRSRDTVDLLVLVVVAVVDVVVDVDTYRYESTWIVRSSGRRCSD
jgi:hypothetical protein